MPRICSMILLRNIALACQCHVVRPFRPPIYIYVSKVDADLTDGRLDLSLPR